MLKSFHACSKFVYTDYFNSLAFVYWYKLSPELWKISADMFKAILVYITTVKL
jgi:hypothetical protein